MTSSEPSRVGASPSQEEGASRDERHGDGREFWVGMDQATIMSLEMMSGILLWGGLGWLLDGWLHTPHWFFGFGVMLGFAAGLYLVWLRTNNATGTPPPVRAPLPGGKGSACGGQ